VPGLGLSPAAETIVTGPGLAADHERVPVGGNERAAQPPRRVPPSTTSASAAGRSPELPIVVA
jgi:hypothetical protein